VQHPKQTLSAPALLTLISSSAAATPSTMMASAGVSGLHEWAEDGAIILDWAMQHGQHEQDNGKSALATAPNHLSVKDVLDLMSKQLPAETEKIAIYVLQEWCASRYGLSTDLSGVPAAALLLPANLHEWLL
jgi:hypothetical protein